MVRRRGGRNARARHQGDHGDSAGAEPALELDFVSDALNDGRRFRVLAVVDDFTGSASPRRRYLTLGQRVVRELGEVMPGDASQHDRLRQRDRTGQPGDLRFTEDTGMSGITSRRASRCRCLHQELQRQACAMNALHEHAFAYALRGRRIVEAWRIDYKTVLRPIRASAASRRRCSQVGPMRTKTQPDQLMTARKTGSTSPVLDPLQKAIDAGPCGDFTSCASREPAGKRARRRSVGL